MTEFSEVRYARSTGGIDIAYQTAGRGPIDLVFVAGFTSHLVEHGRFLAEHINGARYIEGDGDYHGSWDASKAQWLIDASTEFLGARKREPVAPDRVLATVLFTDIVGSTPRSAAVGDHGWRELLDRHDELARAEIARCQGILVKTTGDGILAMFDSPGRAIGCAREWPRRWRSSDSHCGLGCTPERSSVAARTSQGWVSLSPGGSVTSRPTVSS